MNDQEVIPNKKFTYFVGIDVSRNELDFAVMKGSKLLFHREIPNEWSEIGLFIFELKSVHRISITKTLYCMENTGIYGNHVLNYLAIFKAYVAVENPLQIKNSMGFQRGKSDRLDSIRIAQYAFKSASEVRLWKPKRLVIQKLKMLMTLRTRMVKVRTIAQTPIKEQTTFIDRRLSDLASALCSRSLSSVSADLEEIDRTIDLIINRDEHLRHLYELIVSVPGIGRITAIMIIAATNEFIDIRNPKKFACYAGIAPFKHESGPVEGKAKLSPIADKKIKALLHTCAIASIQSNQEMRDYYHRKTKVEGKPKLASINAVRNKLVLRVFACLNQDRLYEHNYTNKHVTKENIEIEIEHIK
jgi:transposase